MSKAETSEVEIGEVIVDSGSVRIADPALWDQPGCGILIPSGFGDGTYPVSAKLIKYPDGERVAEVTIVFIKEEE